jgi:hypothetical protein
MDGKLERLGLAIGEVWAEYCKTPLAQVSFAGEIDGAHATIQYNKGIGGMHMRIEKADFDTMLWCALHEVNHGWLDWPAEHDPALEARCNRLASAQLKVWRDPVLAYVKHGDRGPMQEVLAALAWGKRQAERKSSKDQARRFAAICQKHKVVYLELQPHLCAPIVRFAESALKALDLEVEAEIARLFPYGIKDAGMLAFIRRVLARHKSYVSWLNDLVSAGLLPAMGAV